MGDIVNLRRVRKSKARAEAAAVADENRRRSGQTKAERDAARATADAAQRGLDGHRIVRDPVGDH